MAYAYITNLNSNNVSVIDTETNTVLPTTITVGNGPYGVAALPNWRYIYITNFGETPGTVSVIDKLTNTLAPSPNPIIVGGTAIGIALSPDGQRVYVAIQDATNRISVIDTQTNTEIDTIDTLGPPTGVAVSPDSRYVYVSSSQVYKIDTATPNPIAQPIGPPIGGSGIAVTPDGKYIYVADQLADDVKVIDTTTDTQAPFSPIAVGGSGSNPFGVATSPDGHYVYVACSDNNVYIIDTTATPPSASPLPLGANGNGVSVTPNGNLIYVTSSQTNNVYVIERNNNTHTLLPPITGFDGPFSFGMFITCSIIITLSPSTLPNGTVSTFYDQAITQTGGTGTIIWSNTGNLPPGLTLNTSTSRISGTPTTAGSYPFTIEALENSSQCSGTQAYTIVIGATPTPPSPPSNNERQRLLRELQQIRLQLQDINRKLRLLSRRKQQLLLQRSNLIAMCKKLSEGIATNCQKCRNQTKQIACLERLNNLNQKIKRITNIQKSLLRQRKILKRREQRVKRELQILA